MNDDVMISFFDVFSVLLILTESPFFIVSCLVSNALDSLCRRQQQRR